MRFLMPNHPFDFEIPDEWVSGLDLKQNRPIGCIYRVPGEAVAIALQDIEPPRRVPWVSLDWRGFDRSRFLAVLTRMLAGQDVDPVPVLKIPRPDHPPYPYGFRACDGYHRFYAAIAIGFDHLPCEVVSVP